ncbi:MAG: nucleoside triphosphate pyrophosphohydrolase family protein [Nanoarchaeota archaeon]|nr:nucleoside triphosphate pyrophosphohydrolase family protein [Nanoarchaeota archaeon]MCA9495530.1 nucleoside triphosphate pyrophosphohydrolase family protein [Nanoarchaeota archaeon]
MKKEINDVETFHATFKAPVGNRKEPHLIPDERAELRYSLIYEELEEYKKACKEGNIVEIADALGDILYVTFGSIVEHGLQDKIIDVFNEIQASNMSKLDENGKPIFREDGKILKGPNYFKPDIKKIIEEE